MDPAVAELPPDNVVTPPPSPAASLKRLAMLLAIGWLASNLAIDIAAELPLKYLLKDKVHLKADGIALFFVIGNFTNYIKPIAGFFVDAIPLGGTRRRNYILLGIGGGGVFWILLGLVPRTYYSLLATYTAFYVTVVLTSTSLGGRMVEVGQEHNAAGRLTSQRIAMFRVASIAGGIIGGWLATRAFGLAVGIAAGLHFILFALYWFTMPEKPAAVARKRVAQEAGKQLKILLRSRTLLMAALMVFLLWISPGFGTPKLFYQTDILHFKKPYVGFLTSVEAGFGLIGAIIYGAVCRRLSLRTLINFGIVLHAAGTLLYLYYHSSQSALCITAVNGITATFATLTVYDLAMRATPRGSEAIGYSVMMSVWNFTGALSDWIGSKLYAQFGISFHQLVWVNAGTTVLVLLAVPLTPRLLLDSRDGDSVSPDSCEAVITERA